MTDDLESLANRLVDISRERQEPLGHGLEWPEPPLPPAWYTSPELISLYGTPAYQAMDDDARMRLSLLEAVNFFSLNIRGEKMLLAGLAERLYLRQHRGVSRYLQHFLDEENKHLYYFSRFCMTYGGKVYPDRKVVFPREFAPGEADVLFFAKVLIFEEIVDVYNATMARDARLHPLARRINDLHHRDETRHLAFGRAVVAELFARHSASWSPSTIDGVRSYVTAYLDSVWREYYNPDVYRDAGLAQPLELAQEALASDAARRHRAEVEVRCRASLRDAGLMPAPEAASA